MHCHLIVSRKDQANKKKLSPLTNHKNTTNGVIKGGFERVNLFRRVELGFDKLFGYNRELTESFDYYKGMKNNPLTEQLQRQEYEIQSNTRKTEIFQDNKLEFLFTFNLENKERNNQTFNTEESVITKNYISVSPSSNIENSFISGSLLSFVTSGKTPLNHEEQIPKSKKKKRKHRRL